jgi:ubiquinone/menaquinone biosynthesis C-methylase UbiE
VLNGWKMRGVDLAYGWYISHRTTRWMVGTVIWGTDMDRMFDVLYHRIVPECPETILDVPCGTGVALRYLPRECRNVVALDSNERMVRRVARGERGTDVRALVADALSLPLPDNSVDLCVSLNGLHCYEKPELAVEEMARCLRTGGVLVGTMIVTGQAPRFDLAIRHCRRLGLFGPGGTVADVLSWLRCNNIDELEWTIRGALLSFVARKEPI